MKYIYIIIIILIFLSSVSPALAQDRPSLRVDIEEALSPGTFFDRLFDFFKTQPAVQESSKIIAGEDFDRANEAIGRKIGVNPVDIIKAFVRTIIWILESGVAFFSNLVN